MIRLGPVWPLPGPCLVPTWFLPGFLPVLSGPKMNTLWSICSLYVVTTRSLLGPHVVLLIPTWSLICLRLHIHNWYVSGLYLISIWSLNVPFLVWSGLSGPYVVVTRCLCCPYYSP